MTERQKRFADEYLIDLNATRAYRAAYPAVKRDETAAQAGSRLLRNVNVSAYIAKKLKERQKRTEITQDRVLQELAAIAFTDVTEIVSIRQNTVFVKNTNELTDAQKKAIAGIKTAKDGSVELKLYDKKGALELLGRHLGMWNDKLEIASIEMAQSKLDDLIGQMKGGDDSS